MKKFAILLIGLAILLNLNGFSSALAQVQSTYTYVDLGALGGTNANSYVSTVNDAGMSVGESQTSDPNIDHAFLWTKNPMTDLGGLYKLKNKASVQLDRSNAWGLDKAGGAVVGEAWNVDYETGLGKPMIRAFLWQKATGMKDLGALGTGNNSGAFWVNDNGWVVGQAEISAGIFHAFFCTTSNLTLQDIDRRNGKRSTAWAVNSFNYIVGQMELTKSPNVFHAFLWISTRNGMQDLGTLPGGSSSVAYGIGSWSICGSSDRADGATRAVVWQIFKPGVAVDLGDLGGTSSYAWAMTNWGQVVGTAETKTPGAYHAFTWSSTGGIQDLNQLIDPKNPLPSGVTLTTASSINSNGQILAQAEQPDGTAHVFLLSPSPSYTTPVSVQ